jgi:hypothetical protein
VRLATNEDVTSNLLEQ